LKQCRSASACVGETIKADFDSPFFLLFDNGRQVRIGQFLVAFAIWHLLDPAELVQLLESIRNPPSLRACAALL